MTAAADAERLQSIEELGRAITRKQPAVDPARARRSEQRDAVAERGASIKASNEDKTAIYRAVHHRTDAFYLDGDTLDRGTLTLGTEALHFRGWHGDARVLLENVQEINLGQSNLPPRAGIPVLSRLWPGRPRLADSLLITLRGPPSTRAMQVVLGGLADAAGWREEIEAHKERLADVAARRVGDLDSRQAAQGRQVDARTELQTPQERDETEQEAKLLGARASNVKSEQHQIDSARERAAKAEITAPKSKKTSRR